MKIFKNEKTNKIVGKVLSCITLLIFFMWLDYSNNKYLHHCKLELSVGGASEGIIKKETLQNAKGFETGCFEKPGNFWTVDKFSTTIVSPDEKSQTFQFQAQTFSQDLKNEFANLRSGSNVFFNDIILFNRNGDTVQYDLEFLVE